MRKRQQRAATALDVRIGYAADEAGRGCLAGRTAAPQCVETRARRDWRREPMVAITALGS